MLAVIEQEQEQGSMIMAMIHKKWPEYHPIMAMVELAHSQSAAPELQFNCHKTVAKYVLPELKSVEVRVNEKKTRRVTVSLFDDDIQEGQLVEDHGSAIGITVEGEAVESLDRDGL